MTDLAHDPNPTEASPTSGRLYKRDFWSEENLKFSEPWYRIEKCAKLITELAAGRPVDLLDIGCGPGTLGRLLPPNVEYHGIDIAIPEPAPWLLEADLLAGPIRFGTKKFDIVIASGVFEYLGDRQSDKFAEVADLLHPGGTFIVSYTNFAHRQKELYWPFSNIQSIEEFGDDLTRHFHVDRIFPASHNWKHQQPNRRFLRAANMHFNLTVPLFSRYFAVDYFFLCSPARGR